uniref:Uncharacterized protein n=1 Tax=Anguilla anguilla TaxID=7936 RepID=A0A0E9QDV6_ANGAN
MTITNTGVHKETEQNKQMNRKEKL